MNKTVIKCENIYKEYKLGVISHGTLHRDLQTLWSKARGKEDPNSLISSHHTKAAEKDSFLALNDISLEVKEGEILGIIGKNGAGKSTLLKILSRITSPTSGEIKIKGRIGSLLEVGTGFHPELTGRENIFLNGAILGMNKREINAKIDEIIDFAGIEKHIDTPIKRYSSGMNVRLAFSVAAHLDPEILIIDEVLAVGDAGFQKKCLGKMKDISDKQGRTVLFVSHQMNAIENLCSRGIILNNGSVEYYSNSIREVVNRYIIGGVDNSHFSSIWQNEGKHCGNEYFKPIKFYLSDSEGKILKSPIKNDTDIYVNAVFEVKQLDPSLTFGYDMFTFEEKQVYECDHTDLEEEKWADIKKGINHLRTRIPKRFLNEGQYRLKLAASLYKRVWIINPAITNVSIDLEVRGGLSDSPYWIQKRPGLVAPVFPWFRI